MKSPPKKPVVPSDIELKPSLGVRMSLFLVLLLCLVVITFPRLNRNDPSTLVKTWVGREVDGSVSLGDAPEYCKMVSYFRGHLPRQALTTPFAYRPAAPFLASLLPAKDPMTALNIINLASLALTMLLLHGAMRACGYGFWSASAGDLVFVASFPVFYYGAIGLVDPVLIAVLAGAIYGLYCQRWVLVVGCVLAGALVKETSVIVLPVAIAHVVLTRPPRGWLRLVVVAAAYVVPTILVRIVWSDLPSYGWHPSLAYLQQNLRLRAVASMGLSFGLPGLMLVLWLARRQFRGLAARPLVWAPMMVGVACGMALTVFAFVAAYADGRFLWISSLFAMPFCLDVLTSWTRGRESGSKGGELIA
jgi:hypothetical protein